MGNQSCRSLILSVAIASQFSTLVLADVRVVLENGFVLTGKVGPDLGSIAQNALADGEVKSDTTPIAFIDDGLRRTFFQRKKVIPPIQEDDNVVEPIELEQRVTRSGDRVAGVRDIVHITPFDPWGRRIVTLATPRGPEYVVQGITEITPVYTRLEGLAGRNAKIWDMRVATTSIPHSTLYEVLQSHHQTASPDGYLATVRLLLGAHRFSDARLELDRAFEAFPELKEELKGLRRQVESQAGEQLLAEIQLRRNAGRIQQARSLLQQFPSGDEMAGEVLVQVREMLQDDQRQQDRIKHVLERITADVATIDDPELTPVLQAFVRELQQELSPNSLPRLADFLNLLDDTGLQPAQKLALALGGWLLGSGGDNTTLSRVVTLWEGRQLIAKYLQSRGSEELERREAWLKRILELEGTSPANVARLLAHMHPPAPFPDRPENIPGLFRLEAGDPHGLGRFAYHVQLPPEYDPHRRYPAIVTLHRVGSSPQHQLQWWCGPYHEGHQERMGQATRHGYIVIAPDWTEPEQLQYDFTAREHYAVLVSLRDALQRLSIDTDRVFLSGHSSGGDAAWDIALAHPDLWAGVIPIVANCRYADTSPNYIKSYWENGQHVAQYFVCGELDGDLTLRNAPIWDRSIKAGFNTLVTEYRGRGHEMYSDELQRLFTWMNLQSRDFAPKEYEVSAMRPWDNFFWNVELEAYKPKTMILPLEWDVKKGGPTSDTSVKFHTDTSVTVRSAADRITLWLSPDVMDFQQPLRIVLNGRPHREPVEPNVATMLEDARTRGDRQHPFWAKVSNF